MATNNPLLNQAVRENRFLSPGEYQAPETWLDRLAGAETNPLLSAGLALLTTGQGSNPLATAFQSFSNAAKNKQAQVEFDAQQANLVNAEQALVTAPDYSTYQKALNAYVALPGANKDLMATTAATQREKLLGVPMETGMVLDPATGQSRYVEPVPFSNQLDQRRQLAELEYAYQQKGLDAATARARSQEEWMHNQGYGNYYQAPAPAPTVGASSMVFDPTTGTMAYEQGPGQALSKAQVEFDKAQVKQLAEDLPKLQAADSAGRRLVESVDKLSTIPLVNSAASLIEGTLGYSTEAGEALRNIEQARTPLAIGMHIGGAMTDADLAAYRETVININQGADSRALAARRSAADVRGKLEYANAKQAWLDTYGTLHGFEGAQGTAIKNYWNKLSTGTIDELNAALSN